MNGLAQAQSAAFARPQVGIERLPARRMSNEPRESMNCKSCRKRKIKCNRLRPACEACQVFQCPCIYDAVPKKRGPKTDVLEALLKRVDGLEAKLKAKSSGDKSPSDPPASANTDDTASSTADPSDDGGHKSKRLVLDTSSRKDDTAGAQVYSPAPVTEPSPPVIQTDVLIDTYFTRFHAKPFHILDESSVRQRLQLNQLPGYLFHAICSVAARACPYPVSYPDAVKLSEEYASRSRSELDPDEPSIDALQGLLLLVIAFTAAGKGKKAYMLMTIAVGMAIALELHREMDHQAVVIPVERETRRRLFWTCYLLDRFLACGSKRPSLITDKMIVLRLPCWSPGPASLPVDGSFFLAASNLQHLQGSGKKSQGSTGMLIDITRILGITNRYLAAGGVKGDSHFPWHSLSNLSKIRQDLDIWASGTEDVFSSLEALFGQAEPTILVLSKLIYHLIHCLIYRLFLPIDLSELAGVGQHQSWQIEATNMCFLHANAISELVELGKQAGTVEWPAFVGYCICTAGTVHVHGAHYHKSGSGEVNVFSSSADFLSREMQQLSELRFSWATVQHQRETLQAIYNAHSELVQGLATSPLRYSPAFQLEDFFDRYAGINTSGGQPFHFDAANLNSLDVVIDLTADATYGGHDLYAPRSSQEGERPVLKRKGSSSAGRYREGGRSLVPGAAGAGPPPMADPAVGAGNPTLTGVRHPFSHKASGMPPSQSPSVTVAQPAIQSQQEAAEHHQQILQMNGHFQGSNSAQPGSSAAASATAQNYTASPQQQQQNTVAMLSSHLHMASPQFSFNTPGGINSTDAVGAYDPMFGSLPTNAFSSPAAWHGVDDGTISKLPTPVPAAAAAPPPASSSTNLAAGSPGEKSTNGSTGTGAVEEKDPFLSLLEQLAENEHQFTRDPGSEFDFFFGGAPTRQ